MLRKYKFRRTVSQCRVAMLGLAVLQLAASARLDDNYRVVGDIAANLSVVPAAIVRVHAVDHAKREMHGGPPRTSRLLVIALFDEPLGRGAKTPRSS